MEISYRIGSSRNKVSPYRRYLIVASVEGIPAMFAFALLNAPFLTGYLLLLGANSFQIGLVLAIPTLLNLMQIPAAYWMQRMSSRKPWFVLFASLHRIFWTLTGAVPFLVGEHYYFAVYLMFYLIAFSANGIATVIWTSLIADMVPAQVRGQYFGFRNTLLWGTYSLSLFFGGYLLKKVPGIEGYHLLFVVIAIVCAVNIVTFFMYPNLPFEKSSSPNLFVMIRKPFENKMFTKSMAFISIWQFIQTLVVPLFSYIMLSIMGIGEFIVSVLTIVQTIAMMISYVGWGKLNSRMPARRLLLFTFPIIAAACLLWSTTFIVPAIAVLAFIHILLGVGLGGNQMMVFNFLIGDTPIAERPMYIAVFSAITGLASFIGPAVGGSIFDRIRDYPEWVQVAGVTTPVGIVLLAIAVFWGPVIFTEQAS